MSIAELIPEVLSLSRNEKFQLARLLLDDLASDEPACNEEPTFREGAIYLSYLHTGLLPWRRGPTRSSKGVRRPPNAELGMPIWHFKLLNSFAARGKAKSYRKRRRFRFTYRTRCPVGT
jgi:hypothetical protein